MVAPHAEGFLSTVQEYAMDNGMYPPEKHSPAWVFIELFRPSISSAIESGVAYRKRMNQHFQEQLDHVAKTTAAHSKGVEAEDTTGTPDDPTALDEIRANVREIKDTAAALPGAIAKVDRGVETVKDHVRGVPVLQANLAEARQFPEAVVLELHNRITGILTVKEQEIWRAVRNARGIQKEALPELKQRK